MKRPHAWILALAIIASPPLEAQSAPMAMGKLVAVSGIRADWLEGGVESPNGRFYLLGSYASNDSGFLRYDRVKQSWAYLGRGIVGVGPKWSPNGGFVAYARQAEESREWQVWIIPMDTTTGLASGSPRRVSTRSGIRPNYGPVAWSPDGRRIAFIARDSGRSSIVAVPFNGGDEQVLFAATGNLNTVVWSRDGRTVFVNHDDLNRAPRTLRISLEDKRPVELGDAKGPIIDISADGKWLAQYSRGRVLHLLSTDGKSARAVDLPPFDNPRPSGWSHTNPSEMVALDHIVPKGIQRVSMADGRIRTIVPFDSAGLGPAVLSPDERTLAYIRLRNGVTQLVVSDTSGADVRPLIDGVTGNTLLWSPTGQYIAYATDENSIRVLELASKKSRELIPANLKLCGGPVPNCDGRLSPIAWRSDARALRYFQRRASSDGHVLELREVDLDGRQRVVGATTVSGAPSFIARNDTMFLVTQKNAAVHLVNARTSVDRVIYAGGQVPPSPFGIVRVADRVDANGQWILIVAESGGNGTPLLEQPLLVSLTTGESKRYPYALGGEVSHGDFLPDGRNFLLTACVTCRDPNYVEKWDLILTPMNGDPPRILTGSEAAFKDFWPVATTKDGRTAFFTAEQSDNTRLVTIALPKF